MQPVGETFEDIIKRTGGFPVNAVHRGGGGEFGPENTMHSFRKCLEHGARMLEIDLRLTKDGQLCIMHDSSVERTTNGRGPIEDHTLTELQQLDAAYNYPQLRGTGIGVPSFAEFLAEFVPVADLLFFLDFKDEEAVRVALQQMAPYNMANRYMLGSVFEECNQFLMRVRHSPSVWVCTDIKQTVWITVTHQVGATHRVSAVHDVYGLIVLPPTRFLCTQSLISAVKRMGIRVLLCGSELSKPSVLRECVEQGVDFILTDRPDLLNAILRERAVNKSLK